MRVLRAGCAALVLGLLAGCGSETAPTPPTEASSSEEACPECCVPKSRASYLLPKKAPPTPAQE